MTKTPDEIRVEAAAAAKADLEALDIHNSAGFTCGCGACIELLGSQFRWHWERIARESRPEVAVRSGKSLAEHLDHRFVPLPVTIVPPAPAHVHTPSQGSGIPHCTTCKQVLVSFEPSVTINTGG